MSHSSIHDSISEAFPDAPLDGWQRLAEVAVERSISAGDTVVRHGDEGWLVLVLEGYLALRRTTDDGRELMVRVLRAGDVGGIMVIASRPAIFDIVALSDCRLVFWPAREIRALAATDAGFANDLLDHVLKTFEAVVEGLDGFIYQDALKRVARVLHRHRELFFAERPVLTRGHLSALVGTSREMTGRVLRVLKSQGVVAGTRQGLQLLDGARLEAIATGSGRQLTVVRGRSGDD